jgi:preprotein translocase subunit SecE
VIKNKEDAVLLQNNFDHLAEWCCVNQLKLNIDKCISITFSRRKNIIDNSYSINQEILKKVTKIRDLGIILDEKLTFQKHSDMTNNKAKGLLGFIKRRSKEFKNVWASKQLYLTYVRSILEFGSIICSAETIPSFCFKTFV